MPSTVLRTMPVTVNKPDLFATLTEHTFQTKDAQ